MSLETLKKRNSKLASSQIQLQILEETSNQIPFDTQLKAHQSYPLMPDKTEIFQINLGYLCNMTCQHCHVDAGPTRTEVMQRVVMEHCLDAIKVSGATTVDLTGGAPEMNPDFKWLIEQIRLISEDIEIIVRSNLTILVSNSNFRTYPEFFKQHRLTVVASLPCYTAENTDKQRGDKAFNRSIEALRVLNELGYGLDPELKIHLVYNPGGAFLPGDQAALEKDYKKILLDQHGIHFNQLFTITNLPISRFLDSLLQEDKFDIYMDLLVQAFNPSSISGLMCKNTISVSWEGFLYDCDFNQMLDLKINEKSLQHIQDYAVDKMYKRRIATGQHCYGCTAGAGSSCQGALT